MNTGTWIMCGAALVVVVGMVALALRWRDRVFKRRCQEILDEPAPAPAPGTAPSASQCVWGTFDNTEPSTTTLVGSRPQFRAIRDVLDRALAGEPSPTSPSLGWNGCDRVGVEITHA